jgi:ADP-heptose:LPS heptosyltransferase
MQSKDKSHKSFAIFVRSSYGDLLMIDPLIKFIKRSNPENKITLFVDDKNSQLVDFMEHIDAFHSIPSKGNKYIYFITNGLKYRKNKYDVSIAAKTGTGSANGFFPFILGAKERISYVSNPKKWTDWLINSPIPYNEKIYHKQHYALGVLNLLEMSFKQVPRYLYPKLNFNHSTTKAKNINLLVSVSNNRQSCLLNINSLADIINSLGDEIQFKTYISAIKNDFDIAKKLQNKINKSSSIKITPLLKDFIKLIDSMDICFLGEGGGMHMAAALGIPQVVLFGNTSPTTWSPLSSYASILFDKKNVNNIPKKEILATLKNKLNEIQENKNC